MRLDSPVADLIKQHNAGRVETDDISLDVIILLNHNNNENILYLI